ncbi:hypothetical protein Y032_0053g2295 [Ancylostoma ceylanicum]|uniref:Uncharacterized protein n=1 Tax=Ancylostoma ceylanicum TaxID=53326 RepID=A0A016U850_9BILA|nr:hypothetical protein Y032_0053g2295 [Ancylostoma ceylanicum]
METTQSKVLMLVLTVGNVVVVRGVDTLTMGNLSDVWGSKHLSINMFDPDAGRITEVTQGKVLTLVPMMGKVAVVSGVVFIVELTRGRHDYPRSLSSGVIYY